jgi:hypothetical protein
VFPVQQESVAVVLGSCIGVLAFVALFPVDYVQFITHTSLLRLYDLVREVTDCFPSLSFHT